MLKDKAKAELQPDASSDFALAAWHELVDVETFVPPTDRVSWAAAAGAFPSTWLGPPPAAPPCSPSAVSVAAASGGPPAPRDPDALRQRVPPLLQMMRELDQELLETTQRSEVLARRLRLAATG